MAFIVITADTDEIEHRELTGPLTIGRSPECGVSIRDVLLSRKHCRFEPADDVDEQWVIVDLESKNKTKVNGRAVSRHVLEDGDVVRIGKTRMLFNAGVFDTTSNDSKRRRIRPADPHEALAGTVAGFELLEPGSTPRTEFFPTPQPSPRRPRAYEQENVETLLSGIASSSWDSIVTGVRAQTRTVRATPKPVMREIDVMHVLESDDVPTEHVAYETLVHERLHVDDEPSADDAPRALAALEIVARELEEEAVEMDALAVDALQALGAAVAEARASAEGARQAVAETQAVIVVKKIGRIAARPWSNMLEAFAPTPEWVGVRCASGLLAAAGAIIVAASVLVRAAAGF